MHVAPQIFSVGTSSGTRDVTSVVFVLTVHKSLIISATFSFDTFTFDLGAITIIFNWLDLKEGTDSVRSHAGTLPSPSNHPFDGKTRQTHRPR